MKIYGYKFLRIDDDDKLMKKAYHLRYKVYCEEAGLIDSKKYEKKEIEIDEFDAHSVHFAALDEDDNVHGTIRLVFNSEKGFPLEHHCPVYDRNKIDFPKDNLAEISRLAVARTFRRRKSDGLYGVGSYDPNLQEDVPDNIKEKRKRPIIVFGLYKMMYMESKRRGITHWYAAMEEKLKNTLRKFSFDFEAIGPVQDYSGPVIPFLGNVSHVEEVLYKERPEIMHLMSFGLKVEHMPKVCFTFPVRNYFFTAFAKLTRKI